MKKIFSIFLVFMMLFSISAPAFANNYSAKEKEKDSVYESIEKMPKEKKEKLYDAIKNFSFKDSKEYSKGDQKLILQATGNYKDNLIIADVIEGKTVIVYQTEVDNIQVAVTGDTAEIIEIVDENTFLVDGKEVTVKYSYEEEPAPFEEDSSPTVNATQPTIDELMMATSTSSTYSNYARTGNPGGSWVHTTTSTHNVYFSNAIGTFTMSALAAVIGYKVGNVYGSVVGGAMGFVAGLLLTSSYTNTSVTRLVILHYKHASYPWLYKRTYTKDYAYYKGSYIYLGAQYHYYSKMICNVC